MEETILDTLVEFILEIRSIDPELILVESKSIFGSQSRLTQVLRYKGFYHVKKLVNQR